MGGYKWLLLILLVACTSSAQHIVDQDARVTAFLEIFPEATYSQAEFSQSSLAAISDVIANDCPDVTMDGAITRSTYTTDAATLTAYVSGGDVQCVVSKLNQAAFEVKKGDPSTVAEGILVTVNGEPITTADIQSFYSRIDVQIASQVPQESVLNTLIDQELLLQAASDIQINDDELQTALQNQASATGFETIEDMITASGVDRGVLEDAVRIQLQINKLLDSDEAQITQEQARQFYLENPNLFLVGEQVRFRQIFISFNQSGSRDLAVQRLQQVLGSNETFCELVRMYSDDIDTRENCNEYTIPRGAILPELETALFAMQDGQSSVVESANGFHVVVRTGHTPATVISYADAQAQVMEALRQSVQEQQLQVYLIKLRAKAEIIDYT